MTEAQETTVRQIIVDYIEFHTVKREIKTEGKTILFSSNIPNPRPHYKEIENGKILFGIGTGSIVSDSYVIDFNEFKIIMSNGEILEQSDYKDFELELTQNPIEINMFNMREDLIPFVY
jgi:hypothetical protein